MEIREKLTVTQVINKDYMSDKHYMNEVRARMWHSLGVKIAEVFNGTRFIIDMEFSELKDNDQTTIKLVAWVNQSSE